MFKALTAAIALTLLPTVSLAENFYHKSHGQWGVVGMIDDDNANPPRCIVDTKWKGDAYLVGIHDLSDSEFYLVIHNPSITFSGNSTNFIEGMIEFRNNDNLISSKAATSFRVVNKHTIHARYMNYERFMKDFIHHDTMHILIPGTNQNLVAGLKGSEKVHLFISECVSAYKDIQSPQKKKKTAM